MDLTGKLFSRSTGPDPMMGKMTFQKLHMLLATDRGHKACLCVECVPKPAAEIQAKEPPIDPDLLARATAWISCDTADRGEPCECALCTEALDEEEARADADFLRGRLR